MRQDTKLEVGKLFMKPIDDSFESNAFLKVTKLEVTSSLQLQPSDNDIHLELNITSDWKYDDDTIDDCCCYKEEGAWEGVKEKQISITDFSASVKKNEYTVKDAKEVTSVKD